MKFNILIFLLSLSFNSIGYSQNIANTDANYQIQDSVSIPTKSGYTISATIAKKKSDTEPLPVILFYTTYYQGQGDAVFAKRSADRGYVGVIAYARGIRSNLDNYLPYENEQSDIYEIIDWISKQEWCNGEIGMFGGSYTGFSQWSAAKKIHPALKTIVPQVAIMPGYDFPMQNNVQLGFELSWSHTNILGKEQVPNSLPWEWYEKGFAYASMDSVLGYRNKYFQKWLKHPAFDDYWRSFVPTPKEYSNIDIPVLTTTGYFDGPQFSAVKYFKEHTKYNSNANHYLVIGPYDHWGGQANPVKEFRGYKIDSVAEISMRNLAYDWFDWILKGDKKPELLKDKVNFQVMGTNTWWHKPSIEAMSNDNLRLYLNQGNLISKEPKVQTYTRQIVDFRDREDMNNYFHPNLITDSLPNSNGMSYTSKPFKNSFILNGAFGGEMVVQINKKDIDISISFYEQNSKGNYFLLSRYVGRASFSKNNSHRILLKPHQREKIQLRASHIISKKISSGSRLVIVVNVNKHPFEIINYGSGKPPYYETLKDAGEPLEIKWFNNSYVEVPIFKE